MDVLARTVVVGCGNPNRSDDGAGIRVIHLLKERGVAAATSRARIYDAGTDGMAVMFAARGCTSLIVVDACRTGAEPGVVFEVPGRELERDKEPSLNLHDFRWDHAIAAGRKIFGIDFPPSVTVFLIEAQSLDFGLELSAGVEAATVKVATRIECLLQEIAPAVAP